MAYKKTGIFGGTFDPIHNGHLNLAYSAYDKFDLDKIIFMPADDPYYKQNNKITSFDDRLEMVRLATKDVPYFFASGFERENDTDGYTINTLKIYKNLFPDEKIFFIIGGDTLFTMENWKNIEDIFSMAEFLVSKRKDESKGASGTLEVSSYKNTDENIEKDLDEEVDSQIKYLTNKFNASIHNLYAPCFDISSSEIRNMVKTNIDIKKYVPMDVAKYIMEKKLYGE